VQNLQNVGRAYGGVTDQVLALVAAAISLERVPMETGRDRAIGFGSAALAGVGYGASTGDPALGALGGGLSGFAIAGPAGAIVGGVAGIVSGLASSGQRAREAQRVWERAFDDFEDMFTNFTELQRAQREIEEGFQALSGGVAFDETAERIARLQAIADAAGALGDTGLQQRLERQIEMLEELSRAYATNTDRAEELARAEEERFKEELDVRVLRAQGLDEQADALALQNQQQREYQRAVEQGWDKTTRAFLAEVQAAEAALLAAERAREEWDRVLGVFNAPAGFDISRYSEFYGRGPSEPPAIIDDNDFNIGSVTINVTASDPEAAADAVERRLRGRDLRRGAVR
jgi:parvulin-like peptidyl-prolyl isomerase